MLIKRGDTIRALVKRREMIIELPSGVIPYIGDINDTKVLNDAIAGADNVFHLAAIVSAYDNPTEEVIRVNVDGTRNVLDACEKHGIKHFIFTSSHEVYGSKRKEVLDENSRLMPNDKYGYSKMLAERVIERYKQTVPFTIFRMATLYGPSFEGSFFKIFRILKEQKAYIIGSGKNHLALLHVYDALQAFVLAKGSPSSMGKIYNLSDGEAYTQEHLLGLAADMLGVPRPTRHMNELIVKLIAKERGFDSNEFRFLTSNRILDISKVKSEIGFNPSVSMQRGGMELIEEFKRRGAAKAK
jgi:dTDP-glucose 4,6-dehydratase